MGTTKSLSHTPLVLKSSGQSGFQIGYSPKHQTERKPSCSQAFCFTQSHWRDLAAFRTGAHWTAELQHFWIIDNRIKKN
jgi:hypothetical protein